MGRITRVLLALGLWTAADLGSPVRAGTGTADAAWHYQLIEGSSYVVDCIVCDGPALFQPLRGSFTLRLLEENPLFARYALEDIQWNTGIGLAGNDAITGSGTWRIGGEVALQQTLILDLSVNGQDLHLTNRSTLVPRPWPMIEASLVQDPSGSLQSVLIDLNAAPFHELWFSTGSGFTPSDFARPRGSSGDLLSSTGRVVVSNRELIAAFDFTPPNEELGADAFEIASGGEVLFSLNGTSFSERLGAVQHGDLISERGRRLFLNQQLMEPFGLVFNALDLGLDAVSVRDDGEVLFSINTGMVSPTIGPLSRGDLLSSRGVIFRSHSQLLSRFHPEEDSDFGLDAVHVWPHGEVWFSTEDNFRDRNLGYILAGDILSDQGYLVVRNLDLLSPFQPVEDLADFGLDGLFVVTDFIPARAAPELSLPRRDDKEPAWRIDWRGPGRVFQLQSTTPFDLIWRPASPIVPRSHLLTPSSPGAVFYRLRQW